MRTRTEIQAELSRAKRRIKTLEGELAALRYTDKQQADLFREEAMERVVENAGEWIGFAMVEIAALAPGEYTGEEIRLKIAPIIGPPHHHNAYGALIARAIRRGFLLPTDRMKKMRTARSHGRMTRVYRKP